MPQPKLSRRRHSGGDQLRLKGDLPGLLDGNFRSNLSLRLRKQHARCTDDDAEGQICPDHQQRIEEQHADQTDSQEEGADVQVFASSLADAEEAIGLVGLIVAGLVRNVLDVLHLVFPFVPAERGLRDASD